jgi:hypothetical protein
VKRAGKRVKRAGRRVKLTGKRAERAEKRAERAEKRADEGPMGRQHDSGSDASCCYLRLGPERGRRQRRSSGVT